MLALARGDRNGKVEDPRTVIAQWIEQKRQERDAPALAGVIQDAARALLVCYPADQGRDALWALFRSIAGPEKEG